ncbi:MAG TPA: hypothetical protein VHD90_03145 [Phototrophicaceae bacterium]|nr:hypothetical protein [Phototrophicaceae bacterium]
MQGRSHFPRRALVLALLALLVLSFALFPLASKPVQAQTVPTATPTDQLWLAFSSVRDALEKKFHTDLTIVAKWDWSETQFTAGIDDCVKDVAQPRQLFFGWRFLITGMDGHQYEGRSSFDHTIVTACDTVTTAAAAPTAAPNGSLPPPVAGSAAVGGFEVGGQFLQLNSNTVSLMKRAGMTWAKTQVRYELGQDGGSVAGIVSAAHSNGFKILISVLGDQTQMGDFNSYLSNYSGFVAGVAGAGADAIEVWNEPNIDREWPGSSINGANYTQLLAAAYNAIKSKNSGVMVISAAPSPTGFFGSAGCGSGGCNDDVFMQQMAQAGAANYMDCVGLHYNEGIVPPTQSSGDPRGDNYPTRYFSTMLARGYNPFGGKPVCFTELGYLSGQGFNQAIPASFAWADNTTVAEQASWLAGAATAAAQSGKVRLMIVFNVDFPSFTDNDPQGGYAMLRPDGSCPACDALGAVMNH